MDIDGTVECKNLAGWTDARIWTNRLTNLCGRINRCKGIVKVPKKIRKRNERKRKVKKKKDLQKEGEGSLEITN